MPLSKPAIATISIFSFIWHWNDFLGPLIYLNSREKFTLALALNFFKDEFTVQWDLMMAASLVVMLPCLVIFFAFQRYFVGGITLTGLKG